MNESRIAAIATYLPARCVPNAELAAEFPDWDMEKLARKVGVAERRVAGPDETALDLAEKAAEKLFAESGFDRSGIDFILFCTQSPDYPLPTTACLLQDRLGLSTSIGALDFALGCSGYIYGLSLAQGLVASGSAGNLLLITADTYTKYLHPQDHNNRTIFGDGAAATIVTASESRGIGRFVFGTNGSGGVNLIVKNGGARHAFDPAAELHRSRTGSVSNDNYLYMNGPEIFNYVTEWIPKLVADTLKVNNLTPDDVDYFIFHQANAHLLKFLRRQLNIPEEKFFNDMITVGNTVSSTIPVGMCQLLAEGKIKKGDRLMLVGFGVGYSWGATIVEL